MKAVASSAAMYSHIHNTDKRYINVRITTHQSIIHIDKLVSIIHVRMPDDHLSELSGKILLSLWRLNGIGSRAIREQILKADLKVDPEQFSQETAVLARLGFLDKSTLDGQTAFSLTSIGLAILRQLEEDKLQEL